MLKKVGFIASAAIGLSLVAAPFASADTQDFPDNPTYGDAVDLFTDGGGALGYGAAALVAGAYTGVALTPELIADSVSDAVDDALDTGDVELPALDSVSEGN